MVLFHCFVKLPGWLMAGPVRPFWISMAVMATMAKRPLFSSVVSFNFRSAGSWLQRI